MKYYQRIKDLREDTDKTQQQIASILDIHKQQYYKYEKGIQEMPFHLVIKLAYYYNVSLDYIAGIVPMKKALFNINKK